MSSGKAAHLCVSRVEDGFSVASAGDAAVDHQVQDDFVWLHFSIKNALASGAEFDVLSAPLAKCGSIAANVSLATCWTLIQNMIFGTGLHLLLPGKCRKGLLILE